MDPDACLQRMEDAIAERNKTQALNAYCDFREWEEKGGFVTDALRARRDSLYTKLNELLTKYYAQVKIINMIYCKDGKKTYRVKVTGLTDRLLTTTFTNPEVNHSLMFNRETGQELGVNDGYRIVPDTNESSNNL